MSGSVSGAMDGPSSSSSDVLTLSAVKDIVSPEEVATALRRAGKDGTVCRRLPAAMVVWFVVGLGLLCGHAYRDVYRWLVPPGGGGGGGGGDPIPGRPTFTEARGRLGLRAMAYLCRRVVRLLADPAATPGGFYRGLRLMALDGFVLDVPDSAANDAAFGRPGSGRGPSAFPQVRVLALCEAATHVLWRWSVKRCAVGESTMTPGLLRRLAPGMLLLWDRNFFKYAHVRQVVGRGAHLLARVKAGLVFAPVERLPDGSYLSRAYRNAADRQADRDGIVVRVIEYTLNDPARAGHGVKHRLLTTLLDPALYPALELVELYHVRWEQELAIDELKTHQLAGAGGRGGAVLRSRTPAGVFQEVLGLMLAHYVVRSVMAKAAARAGVPPTRLGFTATVRILRLRLAQFPSGDRGQAHWWDALLAEVGREVLPPRRDRIEPRVIKRKMSKWPKKRPIHYDRAQPSKPFPETVAMLN
jgi:hypothetical protein